MAPNTGPKKNKLSNRMQKQGPPPDLGKSLVSAQKRKLTAPTNGSMKKQKTAAPAVQKPAINGGPKHAANSGARRSTKGDFTVQQQPAKSAPAAKPKKAAVSIVEKDEEDEESSDISGDAIDDPDVMEDELDGIEEGGLDDLNDDELDSDADDFANACPFRLRDVLPRSEGRVHHDDVGGRYAFLQAVSDSKVDRATS